jgi:hypothetical protein
MSAVLVQRSPFDLDDDVSYRDWRAAKLARCPQNAGDLVVDVADAKALTRSEREALRQRIARANMAVYRGPPGGEDKDIARVIGAQLGLHRLDANWLADEDGVSSITVSDASDGRGGFIPYTNRAIRWHTDGYYHPASRRIRAMVLHCVRPARDGGTSGLVDHELLYIALRDADAALVRALMAPDAMTIPAREDDDGVARPAQTGPVFSLGADGALHMRYTARMRSIEWKNDAATRAAAAFVERFLADDARVLRLTLAAGMGIVANNVLHERTAFVDDPDAPRLLYRARYLDRIVAAEAEWPNG